MKPKSPPACDACGATSEPLESDVLAGIPILRCIKPAQCVTRCKRDGTWCR